MRQHPAVRNPRSAPAFASFPFQNARSATGYSIRVDVRSQCSDCAFIRSSAHKKRRCHDDNALPTHECAEGVYLMRMHANEYSGTKQVVTHGGDAAWLGHELSCAFRGISGHQANKQTRQRIFSCGEFRQSVTDCSQIGYRIYGAGTSDAPLAVMKSTCRCEHESSNSEKFTKPEPDARHSL
jgi:hypothetical protein